MQRKRGFLLEGEWYPKEELKRLGARLTEIRKQSGLTAEEFGRSIGVPRVQTLYKIEKGEKSPKAEVLAAVVKKFKVSYDELFGYEPRVTYKSLVEFWREVVLWEETELRHGEEPEFRVDEWFAVLPFFSILHLTDKVLKEYVRPQVDSEEEFDELSRIRELLLKVFEVDSRFISKEIVYQTEIEDFIRGEGRYEKLNLSKEDKIEQLELVINNIEKYSQRATPPFLEIRMLEKPTYAPTSFALYANRIIFNSGDYFLALKNRQAVKEFAEQFNKLWSKCKHGEAVLGFLNDRIKDLLNFA